MTDTPEIAMTDTRVVKKRQVEMHPLCRVYDKIPFLLTIRFFLSVLRFHYGEVNDEVIEY